MRFNLKKDFCLWVVPPDDGRVRKVRISLRSLALLGVCGAALGLFVVFVASDYARVQVLRARSYFSLKQLTRERQDLRQAKEQLEVRLRSLQTNNNRFATYEKSVRDRLDTLASILKTAPFVDVPALEQEQSQRERADIKKGDAGVGGAEIICETNGSSRCADEDPVALDESALSLLEGSTLDTADFVAQENLVRTLDIYIDLIRSMPFAMPVRGDVNSGFGYRISPFNGRMSLHEGVDFAVGSRARVFSTGDGIVRSVSVTPTYGLVIDIQHGERVITRYAHLSRALVEQGDVVSRGELIGLVGSSGRSTGPHLHYEVRVNDHPQNPARYMRIAERLRRIL